MAFCAQFASIRRTISSFRPPKDDFTDILSMDGLPGPVDIYHIIINFQ